MALRGLPVAEEYNKYAQMYRDHYDVPGVESFDIRWLASFMMEAIERQVERYRDSYDMGQMKVAFEKYADLHPWEKIGKEKAA